MHKQFHFIARFNVMNMSHVGKSPVIIIHCRLTNNQKVMRVEWFTDALRARYIHFTSQSIVLCPICCPQQEATTEFQG